MDPDQDQDQERERDQDREQPPGWEDAGVSGSSAAAAAASPPLSVENCSERLAEAKRGGAEEAKQRVYRFMSAHYLQVLRSPAAYGRLTAAERELILAGRTRGRAALAAAETCEAPPDAAPPHAGRRRVFVLQPDGRRWTVLTSLPEEVPERGCGMCTLHNYLFVAGGMKTQPDGRAAASDRVFCFDPLSGRWSGVAPLRQPRVQLRLVPLDGCLYAVGGECLLTVERYDPRRDRWSAAAPLPRGAFAVAHEATSCGGQLFVSGGSLFYRLLRYDARRDDWEECPFTESRRRSAAMVAHRGHVYRFDVERERAAQVSVYKYNTVVRAWLGGARFPLDDALPFRCAVLDDRIYCVSRSRTLRLEVREDREDREDFLPEPLPSPDQARSPLEPFVLSLDPETEPACDPGPPE